MLFTWDTTNLCIVFRQWRITGAASLVFSLLAVAALTAGYEFVREMSRQYEARQTLRDSKGLPRKFFAGFCLSTPSPLHAVGSLAPCLSAEAEGDNPFSKTTRTGSPAHSFGQSEMARRAPALVDWGEPSSMVCRSSIPSLSCE